MAYNNQKDLGGILIPPLGEKYIDVGSLLSLLNILYCLVTSLKHLTIPQL